MTATEIQNRIKQVHNNLTTNEAKLEKLRRSRGELSLKDAEENSDEIRRIDRQIKGVVKDIENAPVEVRLLGEQLTQAKVKEKQAKKDALLSQQKSCAGQMEAISKKLVASLDVANDLNIQLTTVTGRYNTLKRQTNVDVTMGATCRPSEQLLQVVFDTLSAEYQGKPQNLRTQGQPPFVRI